MQDFEKLGVFYLGRGFDLASGKPREDMVLYDSKDLVTHAVCVGMTGSGKTGLCLTLLEEAAIDGIPALVIDPKGDLANLLLTFPQLQAKDFRPWINEDDARKKGLSPDDFAQQQADMWKKGLADWGQDGARVQRLRDAADFVIYTPGSTAGLPVSVLKSFDAPDEATRDDPELFRERISATATSLLGLLGIEADPIKSREHILLSNILGARWKDEEDIELAELIQLIQNPPIKKVGVLDLESFFPEKERFALAMQLNNLLASPGFEAWIEGEPLDIDRLLHSPEGKPRIAIFSIAHLSDAERMFIVSLLLNHTLSWVRAQPGTTSLRAIVYMDEIFGYFPPTANPPSKTPLLTLLKQARAFGVGVLLATQNPVDLDYKGLSNAGTWFLGRLQTERDKARVLEGLEGAAAGAGKGFNRRQMEQTLSALGSRVFLMNNVHDDAPEVFQVRWAMSYLRGPLTRQQIKTLMSERKVAAPVAEHAPASAVPVATIEAPASTNSHRPLLPPEIQQLYIPVRAVGEASSKLVYEPSLVGCARIYYADRKLEVDNEVAVTCVTLLDAEATTIHWDHAEPTDLADTDLEKEPTGTHEYAPLPSAAAKAKNYEAWKKSFADVLFRGQRLELFKCPSRKVVSKPGESERDFRIRLGQSGREDRDRAIEKLKQKYAPKFATLQERRRRALQAVEREKAQVQQSGLGTVVSIGTTVLGAVLGRKKVSVGTVGKASGAVRGAGRTMKEQSDVGRAKETVAAIDQQIAELDARFQAESAELTSRLDTLTEPLDTISIKPKKTNISVRLVTLAWAPHWQNAAGRLTPAW
jgi:hypothetical protein